MGDTGNDRPMVTTTTTIPPGQGVNQGYDGDDQQQQEPTPGPSGVILASEAEETTVEIDIDERHQDNPETSANSSVILRDYDKHMPKKVRRYYKSQTELLHSIDDIKLHLDDYYSRQETPKASSQKEKWLTAVRVAKATFFINACLLAGKLIAAVLSGSLAIVSSVIDSCVDLASGIILWWSSRAIKHVDYSLYPRGRRKLEPVSIVVLAVIMSFASVQVIYTSIMRIVDFVVFDVQCNHTFYYGDGDSESSNETVLTCGTISNLTEQLGPCMSGESGPVVELDTILICLAAVAIKLLMFLFCRTVNNSTIQALAMDHRNDVVSNTSALVFGLIGYHLLKYIDAVGAILISLYIIASWFAMAREQIRLLTGFTASPEFVNMLTWVILNHDDRIIYIDDIKAFHFGSKYFVEVDIVLPQSMGIRESHDIGETLQIKLERLDEVERVFVHVDYETGYGHHLTRL